MTVKEMRLVYRDFLIEHCSVEEKLVVLEADLSSSMSTNNLSNQFGKRYVNVGIMEAEMVGVAAGLSILGYKPYIHTFGPFASRRAFDQIFLSLGYAQLNATIIGSDAGVAAEMNGGTHMPFEDIGLMRLIPKAMIFDVSDDIQFKSILEQTLYAEGLTYIRTTRKKPCRIYSKFQDFSKGYCQLLKGSDITIVASGILVSEALKASDLLVKKGISVGVIDLFRLKPIPKELKALLVGKPVITAENHNRIGGLGSMVSELLSESPFTPVRCLGVDESFGQVGEIQYLQDTYGLTAEMIYLNVLEMLNV